MCSQGDDPTTYDVPELIAEGVANKVLPRRYVLSGSRPEPRHGGSIALATVGDMLDAAERMPDSPDNWDRIQLLREVRERIAAAEAEA